MNWENELKVRAKAWDDNKADALLKLTEHPGPCVVKYNVSYDKLEKPFPTLQEAYTWIGEREQAGEQATTAIMLDDGTKYNVLMNTPLRMGRLVDEED